ncbi:hypothetical protein ACMD2_08159 [Ananas comosus]|uniref:Uncharacterized protein n=1 Tax=Ananas comosus TaxID=4615 RepID=A0A199VPK7_ANACO|nr:hypothetical protein ACMD2_08159 [Ananas comosus]
MGTCASCEATLATRSATAKLVLPDGELREFARPVRASHVLEGDYHACFVCDADEMEIGGFVSAIGAEEELRLDQIYFVLPKSMLRRPLRAEEIAALAVRASAAIAGAVPPPPPHGRRWRRRAVAPMVFPAVEEEIGGGEGEGAAMDEVVVEEERRWRGRSEERGRGRKFFPDLSAIPE